VREECARHGAVVRVQMAVVASPPPAQRRARVFVVFAAVSAAASAVRFSLTITAAPTASPHASATQAAALDGRLFAGRQVRCVMYGAAAFAAGDWER
jgi:hypothetical protein